MRMLTLEEAIKICDELNCQDCPCSDYGNFDKLEEVGLNKLICCEELIKDYTYKDFKEILEEK